MAIPVAPHCSGEKKKNVCKELQIAHITCLISSCCLRAEHIESPLQGPGSGTSSSGSPAGHRYLDPSLQIIELELLVNIQTTKPLNQTHPPAKTGPELTPGQPLFRSTSPVPFLLMDSMISLKYYRAVQVCMEL